jgi:beta-N-acetylhexosaminidase
MRRKSFLLLFLITLCLGISAFAHPQAVDPMQKAGLLMQQLSAEERVGQLFVVSFNGRDISSGSDIGRLVQKYHIGGVVLRRENGNWKPGEGEAQAIAQLTNSLQALMVKGLSDSATGDKRQPPSYVPLLLSMSQEGDGYPNEEILTEAPALPSQMAIGATWNPSYAEQAGALVGRELTSLGVNLLIGPSLDVLERPMPGTSGDLGVRSFGGDPYWVGRMGSAYIKGVHNGGRQKIGVIVTHFPGIGASDRSPDLEIATVLKSMGELQQIDLSPFASVAYIGPGTDTITDGLLVSHIRYQGLQGNIRASTHPISLDPVALNQLLKSASFATWRTGGGLTMSDSLGAKSVRDFYDPTGTTFSGRYIALNAFQSGNDLLQLTDFNAPDKSTQFDSIADTILYFQQQYAADPAFAKSVDSAVQRILALKYRLYPTFQPDGFTVNDPDVASLKEDRGVPASICRSGATLLSPLNQQAPEQILEPPSRSDRILILTDSRNDSPCPTCAATPWIESDTLRKVIISLYGPSASNWVNPQSINSYPLQDLSNYLKGSSKKEFSDALENSTIVIVLFIQPKLSANASPLQDILSQRPDIIQKRNWIVFAMGAPYYLDSTEISKLHGYFGMYSKVPACLSTVARMLFEPAALSGSSPVSINEIGYNLLTILSPDTKQIISLYLSAQQGFKPIPTPTISISTLPAVSLPAFTKSDTPMPQYRKGNTIWLSTGIIVDHNKHPVPDGTVIRFRLEYPDEHIPPLLIDGTTQGGIAEVQYVIERNGTLLISAYSEPEPHSVILQLIIGNSSSSVTTITPTSPFDITPAHAPTATITPIPTPVPPQFPAARMGWSAFVAALLVLAILAAIAYFLHRPMRMPISPMRVLLAVCAGGLLGYDYVAYGLPGTATLQGTSILIAGVIGTGIGALCGTAIAKYGGTLIRLAKRVIGKIQLKVTSQDSQK